MANYHAPGVYVEDIASGPRPIQSAGTSIAAILGTAPLPEVHPGEAIPVTSYRAFERIFCPAPSDGQVGARGDSNRLACAVAGFFANGGAQCYVVNLGSDASRITADHLSALAALDDIRIVTAPGFADLASVDALITHCEARGDRMAILDTPLDIDPLARFQKAASEKGQGLRPPHSANGLAAVYTPWIRTRDPLSGQTVDMPPSAHMAGVYGRTDAERGVHKAPANVAIRGALGLSRPISQVEQGALNDICVNVIRSFPDGIKVWGARTLAGAESQMRYVPVRRLVTMVSTSLRAGTQWVVFEPNDERLWKTLRRDISAYLTRLWATGALQGSSPQEAFFVKCDAETTTQADIDAGYINVEVGLATVKPAEFVVIRIGQTVETAASTGQEA